MQVFLEESVAEEDADTFKWEGRHQRFSRFYDKKSLRNRVISHAQHIPYYVCAALCLILFALNTGMDYCNKKVVAPLWLDIIFLVVLSIVSILIFRFYYDVDLDEIKSVWEKVKSEEKTVIADKDLSKTVVSKPKESKNMSKIYFATDIDRINATYNLPPNKKVCRYMSYEKFEGLLSEKKLYFCRGSKFRDKFEGEIPLDYFDGWASSSSDMYQQLEDAKKNIFGPFISCWTLYSPVNEAMWREYGGKHIVDHISNNDGVCIVTDVRRLGCFAQANGARLFKVHYHNVVGDSIQLEGDDVPFFFPTDEEKDGLGVLGVNRVFYALKRKSDFEHENEVRAILYKKSREDGEKISFDLTGTLVDAVYINPYSTDEQKAAIRDLAQRYGVDGKLKEEV